MEHKSGNDGFAEQNCKLAAGFYLERNLERYRQNSGNLDALPDLGRQQFAQVRVNVSDSVIRRFLAN